MQGPRAGVDACAMGWAPRVWVAMELLVKRSLCFALDSSEWFFVLLKNLANNPPTHPLVEWLVVTILDCHYHLGCWSPGINLCTPSSVEVSTLIRTGPGVAHVHQH